MKKFCRALGLIVIFAGIAVWVTLGSHKGWTKTSVQVKTVDEVTGLEAVSYEKRFVPGIDFLLGTVLVGTALAGVSLLFKTKRSS